MWLEQKVYSFQCEKNEITPEQDILSGINLKVNGILTTVKLSSLFLKANQPEFNKNKKILEIKGWSILERTIPLTGELRIVGEGEKFTDVKLSFYSDLLGDMVISDIENPIFQASDKDLKDEDVKAFDSKIIELSISKKDEEVQGEGTGSPHSNPSLFNKKYENNRIRFINNGYKEYINNEKGNFRLLVKQSTDSKTILLFELLDETTIKRYDSPEEIVENFYQFLDVDGNRKINAKLIDGKLDIEVIGEGTEEPKEPATASS